VLSSNVSNPSKGNGFVSVGRSFEHRKGVFTGTNEYCVESGKVEKGRKTMERFRF
jgi:hypothetical protein